jgi:hypothetical protein
MAFVARAKGRLSMRRCLALASAAPGVLVAPALAQVPCVIHEFAPCTHCEAGTGVALRDRIAAVSAWFDLRVHVYEEVAKGEFVKTDTLMSPIGGGGFGLSVAMNDDWIAVGDPHLFDFRGIVHLYRRVPNGWVWHQAIDGQPGLNGAWFGVSIALDNQRLIVGAPVETGTYPSGYAEVWVLDGATWVRDGVLTLEPDHAGVWFGRAVDIQGDVAVVGAPSWEGSRGAAFVFTREASGWELQQMLPGKLQSFQYFGNGVSIDADTIAIGAGGNSPVHYVYRSIDGQWIVEAQLSGGSACCGTSVDLEGDMLVIGRPYDDIGGAAYVYQRDGTTWQSIAVMYGTSWRNHFGFDVDVDNGRVLVGEPMFELAPGRAWLYGLTSSACCPADCNGDGEVNILDFLCFQGKITNGDISADCNGDSMLNIFDFLCMQGKVTEGCS